MLLNSTPSPDKAALYLLFLLAVLSGSATAADRLEVEIRPSVLNVRQTTSTTSPVVAVLEQGERLTVTTTGLQDWIKLDDKRGFISIHYVNVLTRTPVLQSPAEQYIDQPNPAIPETETETSELAEESEAIKSADAPVLCSANHNNTRIELTGQSKTCRKNLQTMGYESCDILLNFTLSSECSTPSRINVQCAANIVSQGTGPVQKQAELSTQKLIPVTESVTSSLRLSWAPQDPDVPVTQIQLSDGNCQLTVR